MIQVLVAFVLVGHLPPPVDNLQFSCERVSVETITVSGKERQSLTVVPCEYELDPATMKVCRLVESFPDKKVITEYMEREVKETITKDGKVVSTALRPYSQGVDDPEETAKRAGFEITKLKDQLLDGVSCSLTIIASTSNPQVEVWMWRPTEKDKILSAIVPYVQMSTYRIENGQPTTMSMSRYGPLRAIK